MKVPTEYLFGLGCIGILLILVFFVGFFGSPSIRSGIVTEQLNSANLFAGPLPTNPTCQTGNSAYLAVVINNPRGATNFSSITLQATSLNTTVMAYFIRSNSCTQISPSVEPGIASTTTTPLTLYFGGKTASALTTGQKFNYTINFSDGYSITGLLYSQ